MKARWTLLFLIRKKKIDINDIPMAVITRDYLDYSWKRRDQINLDREAEFLFIASLLIYIKSDAFAPRMVSFSWGWSRQRFRLTGCLKVL